MLFLLVIILALVLIFLSNNNYYDGSEEFPTDVVALCQVVLHPDYPFETRPNFDKVKIVYDVKDIVEDCIYIGDVRIKARDHIACVVSSTPDTFYDMHPGFGFVSPHSLVHVLSRMIDEYILSEKLGMIVVSGCMGSGKTTIVREFDGIDGDDLYTEAYDEIAKKYPQDVEDSNMGGVDIGKMIDDLFADKIHSKMIEEPGRIIAVNGNPLPILAKHRFAVKLDPQDVYKRRTKRELKCLNDNYKKMVKDLDENISTFSYNLWHVYRCRLAGVEQYPMVKKQCSGIMEWLEFNGFRVLTQDEIIKEIKKIKAQQKSSAVKK